MGKERILKVIKAFGIFICCMCMVVLVEDLTKSRKEYKKQMVEIERQEQIQISEEAEKEKERKRKEKELETIEGWVNQNENSNFDNENNIMYISDSFPRHFSLDNRLLMANTDVYDYVKKLEGLYPDKVKSYVISFTHDVVDSYGNKENKVVYTVTLNRQELNKVNWEGIEPSMLVELGIVKKYPVLNTIK